MFIAAWFGAAGRRSARHGVARRETAPILIWRIFKEAA